MMKEKTYVLLPLVCVLLVFYAVRAVRRPAASDGAQRIGAGADVVQVEDQATDARSRPTRESTDTSNLQTAHELQRWRLETVRVAERIEYQEAARELQRRQ